MDELVKLADVAAKAAVEHPDDEILEGFALGIYAAVAVLTAEEMGISDAASAGIAVLKHMVQNVKEV